MQEITKIDKNVNYDVVLVIGNGFDLNLDLKTSYNNFMESSFFQSLIDDKSDLASHLQKVKNLKNLRNWIDIENELKQYSSDNPEAKNLFEEFENLSKQLREYLLQVDLLDLKDSSNAFRLLETLSRKRVLILNFNYTRSIEAILRVNYQKTPRNIVSNSFHNFYKYQVHGSIHKNDIIFGVEDSIKIPHAFLKKSANDNFKSSNFSQTLLNTKNIIFFGHAIGETDHSYFDNFFKKSILINDEDQLRKFYGKRNIIIFHYKRSGKNDIYNQLDSLTGLKIGTLKSVNNFEMLDSSKNSCINELEESLSDWGVERSYTPTPY